MFWLHPGRVLHAAHSSAKNDHQTYLICMKGCVIWHKVKMCCMPIFKNLKVPNIKKSNKIKPLLWGRTAYKEIKHTWKESTHKAKINNKKANKKPNHN